MSLGCPHCRSLETGKHKPDCPNATQPIVGYFAWVRNQRDEATCEKRDAEIRDKAQPESIERRKAVTIKEFKLDEFYWDMSIDALAKINPCPPRAEWPKRDDEPE